jgi:perosamine synthetase
MNVAVVGAGKMGLPLACQFANRGAAVIACDINPSVVAAINAGECRIDEPGVPELLGAARDAGRLRATTDTSAAVAESDVVVVIVPALLTPQREVDTSIVEAASAAIAHTLRRGTMVSYETTLPVGGTRSVLLPILEGSGLRAGEDFDLVFSPERVKSRHVLRHLTVNPKVVGGVTPQAAARAADFYATYLGAPVRNVGTLEAAEMVKLGGMVYRDVNIALANELARYAEAAGVDLTALIDVINTDGEAALLNPGVGVGGHCTPVYPYFLIRDAQRRGVPVTLAEQSRFINDDQANHAIALLEASWNTVRGRRALILGLAFRPQVKEHIFSTAFRLRDALVTRGADVCLHDPYYDEAEIRRQGFEPGSLRDSPVPEVVILNTAHPEYLKIDFAQLHRRGARVVVDGRTAWDAERVSAAGLHYIGIGRPVVRTRSAPETMPIARPLLGAEEAEAAARVVRSGWVLQGPQVAAFEKEFAVFTGAAHACAVSSGTAALHLALLAVGVQAEDEVITVSHSYIATANSIRFCGAWPVFVDIDPGTYNIDVRAVAKAITPRTRAILCVHQMGMPCDLAALVELARQHRLALIEDAACAAGSEIQWQGQWQRIGRPHADIACFSFHPRKVVTTGDGGMVTTANSEWDERVRRRRQHGAMAGDDHFPIVGFNYRMTDIQAAVGREQLRRLPDLVTERRALAARYGELLAPIAGLRVPHEPVWARSNWQSYCVRLPPHVSASQVIERLAALGIATRRGIVNAHQQPAYADVPAPPLPESERARAQSIILPLYPHMSAAEQERLVRALAVLCTPTR